MKIKVLIPKWNILGYQVLLKMIQDEKCEYYTGEEHGNLHHL